MLGKIAGFFVGGAFKSISGELRAAYQAKLDAANDSDRIAADERINLAMNRVDAQTKGSGSAWAKVMRAGFALPVMLYNAKLFVWDKMLGLGSTDSLSPYLEGVAWTIVGFYFLDNTLRMIRR